ncbi:MAG: methyltransferase domain-containing protein [Candidatus Omnitrophica bacterium]|nr:methyltransferase domain-containing protein [Candidatus Omnitrophota bacterium]
MNRVKESTQYIESGMFSRHSERYDDWYERNRFAYQSEIAALKKVIPSYGRGLEIGVGTGRFAAALGITVGVDPSHEMLARARDKGVCVRWGRGEDLPFLDCSFDYAAVIVTLVFVEDPLRVLREARRVLKPDGVLIAGIIDRDSFLGEYYRHKRGPFYAQADLLTVGQLISLLCRAGFAVFSRWQTIFDLPEAMTAPQPVKKGSGAGGFAVVRARKTGKEKCTYGRERRNSNPGRRPGRHGKRGHRA